MAALGGRMDRQRRRVKMRRQEGEEREERGEGGGLPS